MTVLWRYTGSMTISVQGAGALYTLIVLITVVIAVHLFKLIRLGLRMRKHLPAEEPKKDPPAAPEPVYYIVEKKKKRTKSSYSDPKRISFKD